MHDNIEDVIVLTTVLDRRMSSQAGVCILFRVIGFRRDLPEMEYTGHAGQPPGALPEGRQGLRLTQLGASDDRILDFH